MMLTYPQKSQQRPQPKPSKPGTQSRAREFPERCKSRHARWSRTGTCTSLTKQFLGLWIQKARVLQRGLASRQRRPFKGRRPIAAEPLHQQVLHKGVNSRQPYPAALSPQAPMSRPETSVLVATQAGHFGDILRWGFLGSTRRLAYKLQGGSC